MSQLKSAQMDCDFATI